jgi:hypothetical protein
MTLNVDTYGRRVEPDRNVTSGVKPIVLEFQPVIVSGGQYVSTMPTEPAAAVTITIDPEKLKK